ncbi:MAG: hypothetical protein JST58_13960 [Bacteroidetes bacterium]|nr:hypothetical protein [Bacteroidota bacterium]
MSDKIIYSSEIQVLSHLLNAAGSAIIVYDPEHRLCMDDDSHFPVATRLVDLKGMAVHKGAAKLCVINNSKECLSIPDIDFIVEFNLENSYEKKRKIDWQYICNPNGTMRWVFPATISKPWFLSFYNFNYWKAAIYKQIVNLAFSLRLPTLMSNGTVTIHANQPIYVEELLHYNGKIQSEFAVFTGTAGPNRKAILTVARKNRISHFYKIALNNRSKRNIQNELNMLHLLQDSSMEVLKIPRALSINDNCIRLNNIRPEQPIKQRQFGDKHALFLNHLYGVSIQQEHFTDLVLCKEMDNQLSRIGQNPKLKTTSFAAVLYSKLQLLRDQLVKENPIISVGIGHGDFTRWNCFEDDMRVYVYDWELSRNGLPLLHDLFHYVVQGAVYGSNADLQHIQHLLQQALENKFVKKIVVDYDLDTDFHLQLYLLQNACYYLDMYLNQPNLHKEATWLFRTWNLLLTVETPKAAQIIQRNEFLDCFFLFMQDKQYVMLKNAGKSIPELSYSSDVDLLVKKSDLSTILRWVKTNENVQKIKIARKSFMTTVQIFFNDISFLSIDLLVAFNRKSIQYIDAILLLDHAIDSGGVKILPPAYDYLYIFLFYQINFSEVPEKYASLFRNKNGVEAQSVLEVLKENTAVAEETLSSSFLFSKERRTRIYQFLKQKRSNGILWRSWRRLRYTIDFMKSFMHNRGVIVTFSGVDGAGKSTILNEVKEMLEKKYRKKVVVIRHRPSMLPILSAWKYGKAAAEQKCVDSLPRQGKNKSLLSSIFRFGYYYSDYLFGQFVVYAKYILRGYIVLYDRYYFDFIVDGKRSNIAINKGFIKSLYKLVYKPELNVFLYAQPEVILKRKKELSAEDITELTVNYKYLFNQLGDVPQYICIENIDKSETISKIEQAFIQLN